MATSSTVPGSVTGSGNVQADTVDPNGPWGIAQALASRGGGPAVVTLTDDATVAVNAAAGNDFRLLTTSGTGNTRIIGTPSNAADGKVITVSITQDTTGNRQVTWAAGWQLADNYTPILSTAPGFTDIFTFAYHAGPAVWMMTNANYGLAGAGTAVFYDNFGQTPPGQLPDASKWGIATGAPADDPTQGSAWYVANTNNIYVNSSGDLVFAVTGSNGATTVTPAVGNYNSARISTFPDLRGVNGGTQGSLVWTLERQGFRRFEATYGTCTIVAKITPAQGFWPAIWFNSTSKQWPQGGEIDLIENFGTAPGYSESHGYGNVIGPRLPGDYEGFGWEGHGSGLNVTPAAISDGSFHTYVMSLSSDYSTITMTMDGTSYANFPLTKTEWLAAAATAGYSNAQWPFGPDNPLGLIMNVCVENPGTLGGTGTFPASGQTLPVTVMVIQSVKWTVP